MGDCFFLVAMEKLRDGHESRRKRALVLGGCLSLRGCDSNCDGDGGIHVLSKVAKQDACLQGDQQTVIFLQELLGFLQCVVIGSDGCSRHGT